MLFVYTIIRKIALIFSFNKNNKFDYNFFLNYYKIQKIYIINQIFICQILKYLKNITFVKFVKLN